jgi:predicted alpha-1,2-mannosidase
MRVAVVAFTLLSAAISYPAQTEKQPADYVDVFIGTSNSRWMLGPYAAVPFGMVQLGPDNQSPGWMGGYEYSINNVSGFSHLHAWTMGGLMVMPATLDLVLDNPSVDSPYRGAQAGYHSRIHKETEKGSPGYYSVHLYDHDVTAELTATTRCGLHRYTFPEKDESRILFDLHFPSEYKFKLLYGKILKVSDTEIAGYARSEADWFNDYKLHFVIQLSKPFQAIHGWNNSKVTKNIEEIAGRGDLGVFVTFPTESDESVVVRTGLSLVSIEQARLNLETEVVEPFGWDFDATAQAARSAWNDILSRVQIEGGTEVDRVKFYTNLYRAYAGKQTWNDVNGKYVDPCENVRQLPPGTAIYGGDAFWNSYWNLNGLWSLVTPEIVNNWVVTQIELFKHTGWTGKGPTGVEYSGVMEGSNEVALMAAAYQKGIRNYDVAKAYEAAHHTMTEQGGLPCEGEAGNENLNVYDEKGYVPYDIDWLTQGLNYAYDDFCLAQWAKALGKTSDYDFFIERSMSYKNLFHPELKFIVPRDSEGQWLEDFDPFSGEHFIEGNSWQYSWYVPHDVPGLVKLLGVELFNERLENGFEKSAEHRYAAHAFDRTAKQSVELYINHGNQVNMQSPYLFNYSGKPWLTQKYARAIMDAYYGSTPYHGWEGDEDEGQMAAWFVMSAMGLFEMDGGVTDPPTLDLGSPLFERITITLDPGYYDGGKFEIVARNNSKENMYIQSATLNGRRLEVPRISWFDVVQGGRLVLEMGSEPNIRWGVEKQ